MKYLILAAWALTLAASAAANALGSLARVSVVDRDSGVTLPTYYSRGEYWVAGDPGARYAIEVRNCAGGRLLAVTSVDGVNVLSGETAGWNQSGYVFDPGERYQITGWRKSNAEVAAFTFTDSRDSYAERTGRPANVGVIGIALFREQPLNVLPRVAPTPADPTPWAGQPRGSLAEDAAAKAAAPSLQAPPPSLAGGIAERAGARSTRRHRTRGARVLVRGGHGVSPAAVATERGHPHSLRQLREPRRPGRHPQAASGAPRARPLPGLGAAALRA